MHVSHGIHVSHLDTSDSFLRVEVNARERALIQLIGNFLIQLMHGLIVKAPMIGDHFNFNVVTADRLGTEDCDPCLTGKVEDKLFKLGL